MTDELQILKLVASRLEGAGIPYMVSGSMALNYYAQPRLTRDIDIVIEMSVDHADRTVELFADDFLCEVDFIVRKDAPYRIEEFSRRRAVDVGGTSVWMVAPEDLLLSKLHWARDTHSEFQLRDARNLIVSHPELDWPYIEKWAADLSVSRLLSEVRS